MLGICAEFERLARVAVERSEQESNSRRKRRSSKINEPDVSTTPQQASEKRTAAAPTPRSNHENTPQNFFTPAINNDANDSPFNVDNLGFPQLMSNPDLSLDFSSPDFNPGLGVDGFTSNDVNDGQATNGEGGLNMGSFQQPFVPQDLWQMPMTLEWDWADMGNGVGTDGTPGPPNAGQGQYANVDGQGST